MFRKLFLVTSLTICSVATLHTQSQIKAQTTGDLCNFINAIDSQFNSERDGATYQPSDLEQCDNPDPRDRAIVGNDDRIPVTSQQAPWASIGRLYWVIDGKEYGQCTGTLVGEDLVLTNSHCIFYEDEENNIYSINQIVFKPNLIEGSSVRIDTATVIDRVSGWEEDYGNISEDWALLRIDKPLGEKYGYLGWRELDFSDSETVEKLRGNIVLAGYSGDYPNEKQRRYQELEGEDGETAGVHLQCSFDGLSDSLSYSYPEPWSDYSLPNGTLLHACDTMGGASGAAILAKFDDNHYYIVGLHRGSFDLAPESLPSDLQEICSRYDREAGGEIEVPGCRNAAVQVSSWSSRAAAMRDN